MLNYLGIWRSFHSWLDPAAAIVDLTYGRATIEEFISANPLIKKLGGDEELEYNYAEPFSSKRTTTWKIRPSGIRFEKTVR